MSERPANYISKRLYFDWQDWESYRAVAELLGQDPIRLMDVCIRQGFAQMEKQIMEQFQQQQETCQHQDTTRMTDGSGQVHTHCADCSKNLTGVE